MDFHKTLWNHRPGKCHIVEGIGIIYLNYNIRFKILKVLYACAKKVGAQDRVKLAGNTDLKHFVLI